MNEVEEGGNVISDLKECCQGHIGAGAVVFHSSKTPVFWLFWYSVILALEVSLWPGLMCSLGLRLKD